MDRKNQEKRILNVFIDSESIDKALSNSKQHLKFFLLYDKAKIFRFIRSPFDVKDRDLGNILCYEKQIDPNNNTFKNILITRDKSETYISFEYNFKGIEEFAKATFEKNPISDYERESVILLHIYLTLINTRSLDGESIFVTNNKIILKNRILFQTRLSGKLDLVTIEEAVDIMDLFAKSQQVYYIQPHGTAKKSSWYWSSFRSKIPCYNVVYRDVLEPRGILEAFASRFMYLLMSIDEIGIQYYFPGDKDIMIPYYFHYFIALITGIFDNLAIATRDKYQINFNRYNYPNRISLSNGTGKEFLRELRQHNTALRKHIDNYRDFINLIYELREISLHKEGFRNIGLTKNERFTDFFVINDNTAKLIKICGDKSLFNDPVSNWGLFHDDNSPFTLLEPYHFARSASLRLIRFADHYLNLLGFHRFIDKFHPNDGYLRYLKMFESYSLDKRQ